MNTAGKIIFLGSGILLVSSVVSFAKTANTFEKLDIDLKKFRIKTVKGGSVLFLADVKFTNPTNHEFTIAHPYIKTYYKGKQIGHSNPANKDFVVKGKAATTIPDINVEFSLLDVVSVIPDFLQYLASKVQGSPSTKIIAADIITAINGNNITERMEVKI